MSKNLKENQQKAVEMLAGGVSCTAVAAALGITKETVSRWKASPDFRAALNVAAEDARELLRGRLLAMAEKALQVVEADLDAAQSSERRTALAFKVLGLINHEKIGLPQDRLTTNPDIIAARSYEEEKVVGLRV